EDYRAAYRKTIRSGQIFGNQDLSVGRKVGKPLTVVDHSVQRGVDSEQRHGRAWTRAQRRLEVGPSLDLPGGLRNARRVANRSKRGDAQPGLLEGRDPQVRPANGLENSSIDRPIDARVGSQRREQDADAQRD